MNPDDRCRVTEELNKHEIEEAQAPEPLTDDEIGKLALEAVAWFVSNVDECVDILQAQATTLGDASYTADIATTYLESNMTGDKIASLVQTDNVVNQWVMYQITNDYDKETAFRAMQLLPDYTWEPKDEDK